MNRRFHFALVLLVSLPVFAQSPDLTGKRLHFFPLIAHGDDFHTILFLSNDAHGDNQCTLDLRGLGLDAGSFYPHQKVVWSGDRATIKFDEDYPSVRVISRIGNVLSFGYANLDCAGPVFARVSFSLYGPETIVGTTIVPDSQRGTNFHFPVLPRTGSLGLAFSNDSALNASCSIQLKNGRDETLVRNSFTVGRYSTLLRFLDDLTAVPRGFTAGSASIACNAQLGAVGLPFKGSVFTAIASVLPRGDAAAGRTQYIPLVADGDGFRTSLFVTNSAPAANRCTLDLQGEGLDHDRFSGLAGSSATFELDGPGAQATITSAGENALAFGYARLECDGAVVARNLLTAEAPNRLVGAATIPGAPAVTDFRFPVLPRSGEFALIFANDTGADIDCSLWVDDYRSDALDNTSLTVPMNSLELRFIEELFEISERSSVFSVHTTCDGPVAAMGMPLNGTQFSAVPPLLVGPPDRTVTAPLLLDAAGCSNGRFVNDSVLAGDCRVLVDFANTLIEGGSTAADLPVRQWGKGDQLRLDDWTGVGFHGGRVSAINLPDLGLRGAISSDLEQLDGLTLIDLSNNDLTGPIPPELGQLRSLNTIYLHGNRLTGEIPPELSRLTNLTQLNLNTNRLTGPIPPELGDLRELKELRVRENFLSGDIPVGLWRITDLEVLDLDDNQLTGPVPLEFGRFPRIRTLNLGRNLLSGPIPSQLVQAGTLERLELDRNELTGTIPPQFGSLSNMYLLNLSFNELTGPIPPQLAQNSRLHYLFLGYNELTGPLPEVFADLFNLRRIWVHSNKLEGSISPAFAGMANLDLLGVGFNNFSGTLPRVFWAKMASGELFVNINGTSITQVEGPIVHRPEPDYSPDPADNGNAAFQSISLFQGPLVANISSSGSWARHQTPILNRRTALAVSINHQVRTPPLVAGRVLNDTGGILDGDLQKSSYYTTESTGANQWRTEYLFDLPAAMFLPGNEVEFTLDPDNELPETNENDNVSRRIVLEGEAAPDMRITFVPFHLPGEDPPVLDADLLMRGTYAYFPISGDYETKIAPAIELDSSSTGEMLTEVRKLWNLEGDADEFYHGITMQPIGGRAALSGWVALSQAATYSTIPHEFGHNMSLRHPPGCDAAGPDHGYPYPEGQLGPERGWDHNWHRFVSGEIERFGDVMSYCTEIDFISDYHYEKAWDYWRRQGSYSSTSSVSTAAVTTEGTTDGTPTVSTRAASAEAAQSLALSGGINAEGVWSLEQAQVSERGPRPPADHGEYRLILYDAAGVQVYEEPLARIEISDSDESFWAARTPLPLRTAAEIVILDPQGNEVLRETLPELDQSL